MNKYYTDIKVELKMSCSQKGDNANELRTMTKAMIENIVKNAIKNNEELRKLFFESKPKVKINVERADEYNGNKNKINRELIFERIKTNE